MSLVSGLNPLVFAPFFFPYCFLLLCVDPIVLWKTYTDCYGVFLDVHVLTKKRSHLKTLFGTVWAENKRLLLMLGWARGAIDGFSQGQPRSCYTSAELLILLPLKLSQTWALCKGGGGGWGVKQTTTTFHSCIIHLFILAFTPSCLNLLWRRQSWYTAF